MAIRLSPEKLIAARKSAGLSQQKAAARVGIALSSLQTYEYGRHEPRASLIAQLAGLYSVDLASLFVPHSKQSIDPETSLHQPPNGGLAPDEAAA